MTLGGGPAHVGDQPDGGATSGTAAATEVKQTAPIVVAPDVLWGLDPAEISVLPPPPPEPERVSAAPAPTPKHVAPRSARAAEPVDTRTVAAQILAELPGSAGVRFSFDDARLDGHLGMVDLLDPTTIMLNTGRLDGRPAKTRDVVRHEIAHIYQGRLIAQFGLDVVRGRLDELFEASGGRGAELAADCVALRFGASWTHYTSSCSGDARQDAVDALIAGAMP